ncbi:MAG: energy-coupling factor ABC transporter ATP-binding protein [Firmicutes bacterium]|nr:energy-coupling factor ABC transporter ATP-binding protein [Bacillota bacterium]
MLYLERVSLVYGRGVPGERLALAEVSLAVGPGEHLGVSGPSGAGKSSLLLLAAGLYPPTSGRVRRPENTRVGLVLQEPEMALFAPTVREELAFAPRALGLEEAVVEEAIRASLVRVGLAEDLLDLDPLALPTAERRLVPIAAVLAGRPDLLFLDEPTAGLPVRARGRIITLVRSFPGTVMVASHDLDFLWRTCPRLVVLARGSLVADGRWREFIYRPEPLTEAGLVLPPVPAVLAGLIRRGWEIEEVGQDEETVARQILHGGPRRGGAG